MVSYQFGIRASSILMVNLTDRVGELEGRMDSLQWGMDAMRSEVQSVGKKVASLLKQFTWMRARWEEQERERKNKERREELKAMLRNRFKPVQEGTVEERVLAFRQWGFVKDYRLGFETLTSPLTGMPKALLEGHCINGIEPVIRAEKRVSRPIGLEQMMDLAQPIEEMNLVIRGSIFGPGPNKGQAPSSPISNHQWVVILPPLMMAQKSVMPSPASSHWPPAVAKVTGEELGVAVLADEEKTDTATRCFEGAALPWAQWEQRRRREIRVGKKANLKDEAIGRRHHISAQAMAKKKKPVTRQPQDDSKSVKKKRRKKKNLQKYKA
ncbi:uncharacterized protein LOC127809831 [Diospyros lotus]|uniref:uncharacterized protein LOC127809831 n=1 Tax=Diospyros lotus TaxID=55363 RepID=UPI0022563E24|nr:uncharacterized protein LOC127809831 [Diospyros lotus]